MILINFFRFLNIYNKFYAPVQLEASVPNVDKGKYVMSHIFKRRHIEYVDEFKVYLSLPLVNETIDPLEW